MKTRLIRALEEALASCFRKGTLTSGQLPAIQLEVPNNPEHGDFATNLAMTLARAEKKAPRQVAEAILAELDSDLCRKVDIAGPGFINFSLKPQLWFGLLDEIYRQGACYGTSQVGKGLRVQVEFVSANPTGPLHIGHGRGAAVGDALASLLLATGFDVQREYYINDAGNQVATLGRSIWLRLRELGGEVIDFPEDGYRGDYVKEIARELREEKGDLAEMPEDEVLALCSDFGIARMLRWIGNDLEVFGIRFDNWYSERSLYQRDMVNQELAKLTQKNLTYTDEGALWFRTTAYGDDKDRVLIKSDGSTTYFASDVAYHMEKFDRGFERVIDVWGADHHGYIPRMKAVLTGLGHAPEDLHVVLIQMVNLLRQGQPVAMGKRSGEFVTLREVVDEVGRDACRFFFLMRRSDSPLDFDLDLAKQQSNDNPVFYVQYAHARVCSINRNASEAGVERPAPGAAALDRLDDGDELALVKLLARYPEMLEAAALVYEPHRVVYYLQELAMQFHSYYNRSRVLDSDPAVSGARLYLVNAVRQVLQNALTLLGVAAPERM